MTISKREKKKRRILDALNKAELSNNRGIPIRMIPFKLTKKQRRHSGWRTPRICGKMKYSEIIEQCLEPQKYWDNWFDYRDGWRYNSDRTHFFRKWRGCCFDEEEIYEINKKIKKQLAIRKAKKNRNRLTLICC